MALLSVVTSRLGFEVVGTGGSVRPRCDVVDVASPRRDEATGMTADTVAEQKRSFEEVGSESPGVLDGQDVVSDRRTKDAPPESVLGLEEIADPGCRHGPGAVSGFGEADGGTSEDVGIDDNGDINAWSRLAGLV